MEKNLFLFVALTLLLAGCAVGPNYHRPAALPGTNVMPAAFTGSTNAGEWKTAQPSAHLARGAWWEMFGDAELNRLEALASTNNQELAAAFAHFQQARALVNVARADYFPQLSANPAINRQRTSASQTSRSAFVSGGITFTTFTTPVDASWELDLWGRVRRAVEGARARLMAAADDLESTRLAIQAEVAIDYFSLRAFAAQSKLLKETSVTYQRALQLTQDRRQAGIATELDVAQAETQLQSTLAQVPPVELQYSKLLHALAALCGEPASTFAVKPAENPLGNAPTVPLALPSELLERRPDIASAERLMAAANADVGVAQAAFYPRVILNGMAGYQAIDIGTLFSWPSHVWALGPSVQLPLFTGGRNRAQLASTRAVYEQTVANYRQTVLAAFQDVEDQLASQRWQAQQWEAENAALKSARRTLDISNTRYKGGVITYLDVVIAQSTALAHEQTVVQLRATRLITVVSLIKALGAGWTAQNEQPSKSATASQPVRQTKS